MKDSGLALVVILAIAAIYAASHWAEFQLMMP